MALNDTLSNALSHMQNSEKVGKAICIIRPSSKLIVSVLEVLKQHNYIKDYTIQEIKKGGIIEVHLNGNINKCGAIKPRFPVNLNDYEKYEKRYLPAKDFGTIIVSTTQGVMDYNQAKEKKLGGRLIAYCYWKWQN